MKNKEKICSNCKLFDANNNECSIIILHEGRKIRLPVSPKDPCFYEGEYFDPIEKSTSNFTNDVKQIKMWVENEKGEKTTKGKVKIEVPNDFY